MDKKNTVKKIIIIAAIAVVILTCALVLIFCSDHQHIPGKIEQERISDATCSSRGSYHEATYCSKCNELMGKIICFGIGAMFILQTLSAAHTVQHIIPKAHAPCFHLKSSFHHTKK